MSGNSDINISPIDDTKRAHEGEQNESHVVDNSLDAEKTKTAYQGYGFSEVIILLTKLIFNENRLKVMQNVAIKIFHNCFY